MDLLDRLLHHDRSTTRALLALALPLSDEALDREFDLGLRTLRATFDHVVRNIEVWTAIMMGNEIPAKIDRPTIASLIERLDACFPRFAQLAKDIDSRDAWDEQIGRAHV